MRHLPLVILIWAMSGSALRADAHRLFIVSKNTNASYVCFDARPDSSAAPSPGTLIRCYWFQAGCGATKALNVVEKMVYGYTIKPDSCGSFRMTFHRFPRQVIWLVERDGAYRALTSADGRSIWLDDIHLVFQGRSLTGPVTRIELRGRDAGDGGDAVVTIDPAVSRTEHPPAPPVANLQLFNRGSTSP